MDINVKVPAIEKLLDYAASGVGSIAGPMLAPWKAGQEAKARRILAEGQATSMQIIATAQEEARAKLVSPQAALQGEVTIGELITQRIQFQEEKRQANIGSVVEQAANELGDNEVQDTPIDHDWTARFFSDVQDVSSEDMQLLWARILAGEVERPGSTAIKTLQILKNLDKTTATIFRNLCSICVSLTHNGVNFYDSRALFLGAYSGGNALRNYGLDFEKLNVLSEHGLINPEYNTWRDYRGSIRLALPLGQTLVCLPLYFQGKYWILVPVGANFQGNDFKLFGAALTGSGREISRVIGLMPAEEYTLRLTEHFMTNDLQMTEVPRFQPILVS